MIIVKILNSVTLLIIWNTCQQVPAGETAGAIAKRLTTDLAKEFRLRPNEVVPQSSTSIYLMSYQLNCGISLNLKKNIASACAGGLTGQSADSLFHPRYYVFEVYKTVSEDAAGMIYRLINAKLGEQDQNSKAFCIEDANQLINGIMLRKNTIVVTKYAGFSREEIKQIGEFILKDLG